MEEKKMILMINWIINIDKSFKLKACINVIHILFAILALGKTQKKVLLLMAGPLRGGGGVKGRPLRKK